MTHDPDLIQTVADGLQDRHDIDTPWTSYAEGALDALCAAHPDVAAVLRGEAVAVPREPLREMWAAGGNVLVSKGRTKVHHDVIVGAVWNDMLAASPWAKTKKDKP